MPLPISRASYRRCDSGDLTAQRRSAWNAAPHADVAKSVDAADLKSASHRECGFKSRRPYQGLAVAPAFMA